MSFRPIARLSPKSAEFSKYFEKILSSHFNFTGPSGYHYDRKDRNIFPPLEKIRWLPLLPPGLLFFVLVPVPCDALRIQHETNPLPEFHPQGSHTNIHEQV